jgi:hypothetical protein
VSIKKKGILAIPSRSSGASVPNNGKSVAMSVVGASISDDVEERVRDEVPASTPGFSDKGPMFNLTEELEESAMM